MSQCVILGGGISGLSLAHFLRRSLGATKKIVLIEGSDRAGGWMRTANEGEFLFEKGARSFRPSMNGVEMLRLIEQLGLQEDVHMPSVASKTRYIYANGALQKLPSSIGAVLSHPLMKGIPQSGIREMFVKKSTEPDESIHDFIERRFSLHVAENLIDPLISGIFAGDTKKLSIQSCLGLLHTLEQEQGSVVRGMLKRSLSTASGNEEDSDFVTTASKCTSLSFKGGMQTITDKLLAELSADPYTDVMLNTPVLSLAEGPHASSEADTPTTGPGAHVVVGGASGDTQVIEASHVFSTLPAPSLAQVADWHARDVATVLHAQGHTKDTAPESLIAEARAAIGHIYNGIATQSTQSKVDLDQDGHTQEDVRTGKRGERSRGRDDDDGHSI